MAEGVENERKRARGARPTRGERTDEDGASLPLAVCVFNFPGPFCMQISSVIYPRAEAGERRGGSGMTEECTCGE